MDIRITPDGIVSFVEEKIYKQVELKDFIENLKSVKPVSTGFLPSGCILFYKEGASSTYVFEETPQIRVLNWRNNGNITPYPLSLPFIYWIIKTNGNMINSVMGRASKIPVRSMDTELFNMGLPNFHDSGEGEMCRGSVSLTVGENVHSSIRTAVNKLWDTNWNGDLTVRLPGVRDYADWAEMTVRNPLLWMELDLKPCSKGTFGDLLESP